MLKYVEARDHLGRADKIVEMGGAAEFIAEVAQLSGGPALVMRGQWSPLNRWPFAGQTARFADCLSSTRRTHHARLDLATGEILAET